MIQFACPTCQKQLRMADEHAGKSGKCPQCKTRMRVPQAKGVATKSRRGPQSSGKPINLETTKFEEDNIGTRQDSIQKADMYWLARQMKSDKEPYVLYFFPTEEAARDALLELPCIHLASDTRKLICTAALTFGYYRSENGAFEAIIAGHELDTKLFELTRDSFRKHGGKPQGMDGEMAPPPSSERAAAVSPPAKSAKSQVTFVKSYTQPNRIGTKCTYEVFHADDAESAQEFLQSKPVPRPLHYVIVETPQGNYGRDINGIYKE